MTVTQRLFIELENHNLTMANLCAYINVKSNVVANWKTQNTVPPAKYLVIICEFIGISTDYLLTGKETQQKSLPPISEDKQKLLELYDLLTEREQGEIIGELKERTRDRGIEKVQVG